MEYNFGKYTVVSSYSIRYATLTRSPGKTNNELLNDIRNIIIPDREAQLATIAELENENFQIAAQLTKLYNEKVTLNKTVKKLLSQLDQKELQIQDCNELKKYIYALQNENLALKQAAIEVDFERELHYNQMKKLDYKVYEKNYQIEQLSQTNEQLKAKCQQVSQQYHEKLIQFQKSYFEEIVYHYSEISQILTGKISCLDNQLLAMQLDGAAANDTGNKGTNSRNQLYLDKQRLLHDKYRPNEPYLTSAIAQANYYYARDTVYWQEEEEYKEEEYLHPVQYDLDSDSSYYSTRRLYESVNSATQQLLNYKTKSKYLEEYINQINDYQQNHIIYIYLLSKQNIELRRSAEQSNYQKETMQQQIDALVYENQQLYYPTSKNNYLLSQKYTLYISDLKQTIENKDYQIQRLYLQLINYKADRQSSMLASAEDANAQQPSDLKSYQAVDLNQKLQLLQRQFNQYKYYFSTLTTYSQYLLNQLKITYADKLLLYQSIDHEKEDAARIIAEKDAKILDLQSMHVAAESELSTLRYQHNEQLSELSAQYLAYVSAFYAKLDSLEQLVADQSANLDHTSKLIQQYDGYLGLLAAENDRLLQENRAAEQRVCLRGACRAEWGVPGAAATACGAAGADKQPAEREGGVVPAERAPDLAPAGADRVLERAEPGEQRPAGEHPRGEAGAHAADAAGAAGAAGARGRAARCRRAEGPAAEAPGRASRAPPGKAPRARAEERRRPGPQAAGAAAPGEGRRADSAKRRARKRPRRYRAGRKRTSGQHGAGRQPGVLPGQRRHRRYKPYRAHGEQPRAAQPQPAAQQAAAEQRERGQNAAEGQRAAQGGEREDQGKTGVLPGEAEAVPPGAAERDYVRLLRESRILYFYGVITTTTYWLLSHNTSIRLNAVFNGTTNTEEHLPNLYQKNHLSVQKSVQRMASCTNNFHCLDNQYCQVAIDQPVGVCVTIEPENPSVCYRSEDCDSAISSTGKFCGKPGATQLNCGTCPYYGELHGNQYLLNAHNCNCGSAKYCNNCEGQRCHDCIQGYYKFGYECVLTCPIEGDNVVMTREVCMCGQNYCQLGQKCTKNGTSYQCKTEVNDCKKNYTCTKCETANPLNCEVCIDGYYPADGVCVRKEDCTTGSEAVPNCIACDKNDDSLCAACADTYTLNKTLNYCIKTGCQSTDANCEICASESACQRCKEGYILGLDEESYQKKCIPSELSCRYDTDCKVGFYCKLVEGTCIQYKITTSCFVSTQCYDMNTYCKNPGQTKMAECSACPVHGDEGFLALKPRGCNCGTALNCRNCDGADRCYDCVVGFAKNAEGVCIKECPVDATSLTSQCVCQGYQCEIGQHCSNNGCYLESDDNKCKFGASRIENCVQCLEQTKCQKCADGFNVSTDNTACEYVNNCLYGSTAVEFCAKCSDADSAICAECKSFAELTGGKCELKTCLSGASKVEHCTYCNPVVRERCLVCENNYLLSADQRTCTPGYTCTTDYDCSADSYCNLTVSGQLCTKKDESAEVCYRSTDCTKPATYCQYSGSTKIGSCPKCSGGTSSLLDRKSCNCGPNEHCSDCADDNVCSKCNTNYGLIYGKCYVNCPESVALTSECNCGGIACAANKYCQSSNQGDRYCVPYLVTDNCVFGDMRVENCVACYDKDVSKCKECKEGFQLDAAANTCKAINNCLYGPSAVANCKKCTATDEKVCELCDQNYYLTGEKMCEKETCLVGSQTIDKCIACAYTNDLLCKVCIPGYTVDIESKKCIEGCSNDWDCENNQVCDAYVGKCKKFTPHEIVCMRSDECEENNKVCKTQGTTHKMSCGACVSTNVTNMLAVAVRGCNCDSHKYCAVCTEVDGSWKCAQCLDGYVQVQGECQKPCAETINTISCACGQSSCKAGYYCKNNKCEAGEDSCVSGESFIPHCLTCGTDKKTCASCAEGYNLVNNKCMIYDCKDIDKNCVLCDEENDRLCKVCADKYELASGKCKKVSKSNNALVIGCSVGGAVVILIIGGVIGYFLWKRRKVNGKIENLAIDRKRDLPTEQYYAML